MPPTSAASGCSTSRQPSRDQIAELVELARHLAAGDADVDHVAQAPHALAVAAMQRLLHPVDAEALQFARDLDRVLQRPRGIGVPRHAPALIAVDHQFEPVADARAHRLQRLHVVAPVAAMEADLQRREALRQIALRRVGESRRRRAACRTRHRRARGRRGRRAASSTGWPASLPARSHSARSSGQQRPQWKLMLLRMRQWRSIAARPGRRTDARGRRSRASCRRSRRR